MCGGVSTRYVSRLSISVVEPLKEVVYLFI